MCTKDYTTYYTTATIIPNQSNYHTTIYWETGISPSTNSLGHFVDGGVPQLRPDLVLFCEWTEANRQRVRSLCGVLMCRGCCVCLSACLSHH